MVVQELEDLKQEKKQLQQKCEQQEQALQEMGLHLSQSVFKSWGCHLIFVARHYHFIEISLLIFHFLLKV